MGCNLLTNGLYWGYNPVTINLLTSWDIQVDEMSGDKVGKCVRKFNYHPRDIGEGIEKARDFHVFVRS